MNSLLQLNDALLHAPAGVIAILFAVALGYMLKASVIVSNNRIPLFVLPVTAIMFALIQLCADLIAAKDHAWLYLPLNFMIGFIFGLFAWLLHAQILKRFLDPRIFNDDGTTRLFAKPDNQNPKPPENP
jgi:hypothetical protein